MDIGHVVLNMLVLADFLNVHVCVNLVFKLVYMSRACEFVCVKSTGTVICAKCKNPVNASSCVHALGEYWHVECFVYVASVGYICLRSKKFLAVDTP